MTNFIFWLKSISSTRLSNNKSKSVEPLDNAVVLVSDKNELGLKSILKSTIKLYLVFYNRVVAI